MAESISPFDDKLFKLNEVGGGFINDETPLDAYNMNLLVKASLLNKQSIQSLQNENEELSERIDAIGEGNVELLLDSIVIDGMGVPNEVLDGESAEEWDGSYEDWTFGEDE